MFQSSSADGEMMVKWVYVVKRVVVFVSRSRRLLPLDSVIVMSWEARIFLICLVREGWKGGLQ